MSRVIMSGDIYKGMRFCPTFQWGTFSEYQKDRIFIFSESGNMTHEIIRGEISPGAVNKKHATIAGLEIGCHEIMLFDAITKIRSSPNFIHEKFNWPTMEDWCVILHKDVLEMGKFLGNISNFTYKSQDSMPEHHSRIDRVLGRRMADE